MRNVIVTMFVSLDGVIESPEKWSMVYWNDEISKIKHEELYAADAMLLGRVTYDGFAAAWPGRPGEFADRMNTMPKYVASKTPRDLAWKNSSRLDSNIGAAVTSLKQQPGRDMLVYGGTAFVNTLLAEDLVDEYRLLVYPIVLGRGKRLFTDDSHAKLKLNASRDVGSGVVLLSYAPAR